MPKKIKQDNKETRSYQLHGLSNYFEDLVNLYKKKKFPKVLLLTGEKGIGKYTLTFHLINFFLSDQNNPYNLKNKLINEENIFYKQIISNTSQNFFYIPNEKQKKTGIDDIRELKKKLNNSTLNNLPRFIIFDDVEYLNINAANSMLKLIEEPSNTNFFILINNKKNIILETIKSRSIEFKIFLKDSDKKSIFDKLSKHHGLENHFSHEYINFTSPGLLIKFSELLNKNNIDIQTSFYDATSIFLEKFKKTKNEILLDCINFFLEIKSSKIHQKINNNFIMSIQKKNDIMKLLYNYKKFNLTNNAVLDYIKKSTINNYV